MGVTERSEIGCHTEKFNWALKIKFPSSGEITRDKTNTSDRLIRRPLRMYCFHGWLISSPFFYQELNRGSYLNSRDSSFVTSMSLGTMISFFRPVKHEIFLRTTRPAMIMSVVTVLIYFLKSLFRRKK